MEASILQVSIVEVESAVLLVVQDRVVACSVLLVGKIAIMVPVK